MLAARGVSSEAASAIAMLCEIYWVPVYAFIRRTGRSGDEARDLTQAFFTRVLEKDAFKSADRQRGRFRTFLLTSVRHFLSNQHDFDSAQKRGGGRPPLPLEFDDGERQYLLEPVDDETPERVYERRWAQAVLAQATARLSDKFAQRGRQEAFVRLQPFLTGEDPDFAPVAAEMRVSVGALRVAVHRLRQQFRQALEDTIGETVDGPDELEEEVRYLLAVLGR